MQRPTTNTGSKSNVLILTSIFRLIPISKFRRCFELIDAERVMWFEKSRDLMLSRACVAYLTLQAMKTPFRGVLFQTQKEDKVIQLVEYAKCLYRTQPEWLQETFPLKSPIEKQPALELQFASLQQLSENSLVSWQHLSNA